MHDLVEFIPNISEGRDVVVINAIADSVRNCPGVRLLNVSSDSDHNRTVLTIVGELDAMPNCVEKLYEAAIPSIDLRRHQGVHPRIGAVDVAPFVPLGNTTTEDCITLAGTVGARIAERFDLPVFLYGESAQVEHKLRLADIRRGGFEGLSEKLAQADWRPDFGPAIPHFTAGATAIGARFFLIAYNVVLDTDDLPTARVMARKASASSVSVPKVRALGFYLNSLQRVQVSMNLLDYRVTDIPTAYRKVESLADVYETKIVESEIVGMIPRAALGGVDPKELKITKFSEELVLDNFIEL